MGWDEPSGLYFVADGMGGHASGDVASRIVKETLLGPALKLPLRAAVRRAHDEVAQAAADNTAHANMGSTVILLFPPGAVTWDDKLKAGNTLRMGERIGTLNGWR